MLNAALEYIQQGWSVIPLGKDKRPHFQLLKEINGHSKWEGYRMRPASEFEIKEWFRRYPDTNIGILTGQASDGLVVIDFDKNPPAIPFQTPMVRTSRGLHLYLKTSKPVDSFDFPLGEVQAEGKYVAAPPSVHPSGKRYEWIDGFSPAEGVELEPFTADRKEWLENLKGSVTRKEYILSCYTSTPTTLPNPLVSKDTVGVDASVHIELQRWLSSTSANPDRYREVSCTIPYEKFARDPEVAFRILGLLGVKINKLGKTFCCPIPGHEEKKPSAALYIPHADGFITMKDFHKKNAEASEKGTKGIGKRDAKMWPLPDLYAIAVTGKEVKLEKGERAIWWIRALVELGYITPPTTYAPRLPKDAPEPAKKLYKGFTQLLACRELYQAMQKGTPFSWRFARKWCEIGSNATVKKGMEWLLKYGYLHKIGESKNESKKTSLFAVGQPREFKQPLEESTLEKRGIEA